MSETILSRAAKLMHSATSAINGATVTFTRPNIGSVNVTATRGKGTLVVDHGAGARIEVESNDFHVRADALVIAGDVVTPIEGDRITDVVGSSILTYEVMTPPYNTMDNAGALIRIHTKLINAA